jgi:NTP pyrophosphatase (non-canonical NTP hydrolase)
MIDTSKLEPLGKAAGDIRRMFIAAHNMMFLYLLEEMYEVAIAAIDAEVQHLKKLHPDRFWKTSSKEYQALAYKWASERKARKAMNDAKKASGAS